MNSHGRGKAKSAYLKCAFTGYRPSKMPFGYDENRPDCIAFKRDVHAAIEELIGNGYAHFLSGCAQGFDTFAAEAVVELREEYPWIMLEMVSPFDAQAAKWSEDYQLRREKLIQTADIVTATSHEYTKGCLFRRNRYLVDNADLLLAAYDGQPGGTAMTCAYALQTGVPIQTIMPTRGQTGGLS